MITVICWTICSILNMPFIFLLRLGLNIDCMEMKVWQKRRKDRGMDGKISGRIMHDDDKRIDWFIDGGLGGGIKSGNIQSNLVRLQFHTMDKNTLKNAFPLVMETHRPVMCVAVNQKCGSTAAEHAEPKVTDLGPQSVFIHSVWAETQKH